MTKQSYREREAELIREHGFSDDETFGQAVLWAGRKIREGEDS